jgi:glycosyltransferase involved in cell wall biosynthesis
LKIRVCLDLRICQKSSRYTGVGIYAQNLSRILEENNSEFEFWFVVLKGIDLPWNCPSDRLIYLKRPRKPESFQEMFDFLDLKSLLKKNNISIYHSLVPGMLTSSKSLLVINTLHDIIPDVIPREMYKSFFARCLYKFKIKILRFSSHIIVDSIATKNDFISFYNFYIGNNISVIYLGSQFSNRQILELQNNQVPVWHRKYLLYAGGFNFRKNVPNVIKAFSIVAKNFPEVDLLLIGSPSKEQFFELNHLIKYFPHLNKRVIFKGFIPDSDLPNYYCNSEAFVYPSFYEGFGIPVLEAMQCSAPVITSNRGSIPEIVGSSGILVNPESILDISEAMLKILKDSNLQEILKSKGLEQAKLFSWENCALETLKIYRKVLDFSKL